MKNCFLIFLVATVLVSCSSREKERTLEDKRADLYFGQGTYLLTSKQYTKALKNLLEANKYRPNDSKILNNLGMAYFLKGSQSLAVNYLKESLKIDPKNSDARMNLATIYLDENQLDLAESQYNAVLKDLVYEHQYKTQFNLAMVAYRRGNILKTKSHLKESIAVNDGFCPASFFLGKLNYKEGNYDAAKENFKLASLGLCFQEAEPQIYFARTLAKQNKFFEAEQKLNEIIETFAMTKWEAIARQEITIIKKNQNQEVNKTIQAKKSKRNFFTPDF